MKNTIRAIAVLVMTLICTAASALTLASVASCAPGPVGTALQRSQNIVVNNQQVTPDEYYHQVWELVRDNFLYQERLTDWQKWENKYDGKLNTFTDAEQAINEMLDSLGDGYTYFKNATLTKAKQQRDDARNVVSYRMLPGNIGYIRIRTFSSHHTAEETKAALQALKGADAYVLDLRGNGGGYIHEARSVFSLFVDTGTFTTLRGRYDGDPYRELVVLTSKEFEVTVGTTATTTSKSAREPNLTGNKPVVVLVNQDTASASEMLSGALRDNGRAELLGTRTFGKGIAQLTWNLPRSTSVQITYARYYLPGGSSIHGTGITPHRVVKPSGSGDVQLSEALKVIDQKLGR
ncbi:MAG TPA: S41 family peptidase [Candidatus Obscuribacterales bacterium]